MTEKIRWGIVSTGHISHRFAGALQLLPEAEIHAVASRTALSAEKFAREFGIPKAYSSYSALAEDPEVDVVYIGTPHTFHLENSLMCMKLGLKESPRMPLDESLQIMQIMDKIRAPWELKYSNDIQKP
jgi:dihydrodiol dehydrogenase / D-xylose 1-dehydrogenase (NADP)